MPCAVSTEGRKGSSLIGKDILQAMDEKRQMDRTASLEEETSRTLQGGPGEDIRLDIDGDDGAALSQDGGHNLAGEVGRSGCADNDEKSGPAGCLEGALKSAVWPGLGRASKQMPKRKRYHFQTSSGVRRSMAPVAISEGM